MKQESLNYLLLTVKGTMKSEEKKIRALISNILKENFFNESIGGSEKKKLMSLLNALEFKNDIIAAGGEIYAVGGIVRDAVMNTPSDDLDIVVRGVPYERLFSILSRYGKATDTSHEKEGGEKDFGSTKFVSRNDEFNKFLASNGVVKDIDVMLPRKDAKDPNIKGHKGIKSDVNPKYTIQDDLERRDITINAIAMDLNGNLITNGSGLEDIKNGVIKAVSEDSFIEDPLRMLRAVRFAARYGYDWDPGTISLIKNNTELLADKEELPRERFLMEFTKMIGKADLKKAVKLLVDLGMFQTIFGVEPKIDDYNKFDKAKSVAEFSYMLFDKESPKNILRLITNNITNSDADISYIEGLNDYLNKVKGKDLDFVREINELANIYNKSNRVLLDSSYIEPKHREIASKFMSGEIPKGEHDIAFKGSEFRDFVIDVITQKFGEFTPRIHNPLNGKAKDFARQAIYSGVLDNNANAVKDFLIDNLDQWAVVN